jgi:hypothetical protein
MIRATILAVSLALVAGAAHAATISTGTLQGQNYLICSVTNVGTKAAKISSVKIFDDVGTEFETQGDTCGAVLAPRATCAVQLSGETFVGHCEAVGTGQLRVSLQAFGVDGILSGALPGTK